MHIVRENPNQRTRAAIVDGNWFFHIPRGVAEKKPEIHPRAIPLVVTIEHLAQNLDPASLPPAIVEVGPIPTEHYMSRPVRPGKGAWSYNQDQAFLLSTNGARLPSFVPPIKHLADRHPEWKLAAVSPDNIEDSLKKLLLGEHADIFMSKLGPDRNAGFDVRDSENTAHFQGQDIGALYPLLLERLGGARPNIICGRHVFDRKATSLYPVTELTAVAAMLLRPGGYFVSHVYGSTRENSRVPVSSKMPFDWGKSMELSQIFKFNVREWSDFVFVWKKRGDFLQKNRSF